VEGNKDVRSKEEDAIKIKLAYKVDKQIKPSATYEEV
jgi:hypothetical protein